MQGVPREATKQDTAQSTASKRTCDGHHSLHGTRVSCETELEREAHHLQTTWLRRQGALRKVMLVGWAAQAIGRCAGDMPTIDH